jgi:pilus assembly protein Flp/PilA
MHCGFRGTPVAISAAVLDRSSSALTQTNCGTPQHRTAKRCEPSGGFMTQLVAFVKSVARNEEGQDLLEYALLVALIALVAIAAVGAAGGAVNGIFTAIAGALGGAA